MGKILIALGVLEFLLPLIGRKPLTGYAKHPLLGPLLAGVAESFKVHLDMER